MVWGPTGPVAHIESRAMDALTASVVESRFVQCRKVAIEIERYDNSGTV